MERKKREKEKRKKKREGCDVKHGIMGGLGWFCLGLIMFVFFLAGSPEPLVLEREAKEESGGWKRNGDRESEEEEEKERV